MKVQLDLNIFIHIILKRNYNAFNSNMEGVNVVDKKEKLLEQKEVILILQLLDHFNEIRGKTRLTKYLFLLEKEGNLGLHYGFISKHYGPYSPQLDAEINTLKELGFIREFLERDGKTVKFRLTSKGFEMKENYITDFNAVQTINKVLNKYSEFTLKELIDIVYANYPEYTRLSKLVR